MVTGLQGGSVGGLLRLDASAFKGGPLYYTFHYYNPTPSPIRCRRRWDAVSARCPLADTGCADQDAVAGSGRPAASRHPR